MTTPNRRDILGLEHFCFLPASGINTTIPSTSNIDIETKLRATLGAHRQTQAEGPVRKAVLTGGETPG